MYNPHRFFFALEICQSPNVTVKLISVSHEIRCIFLGHDQNKFTKMTKFNNKSNIYKYIS